MEQIKEMLEEALGKELIQAVLSGARLKEGVQKIKVRPILLGENLCFQSEEWTGKQVFHHNGTKEETISYLMSLVSGFKQVQVETNSCMYTALLGKKGKVTLKKKKNSNPGKLAVLNHNKEKRYILKEGEPIPFLVDLQVMTKEGKIIQSRYDKFRQMNRFLEFIEDVLPCLPKDRPIRIIDFGCGKSYLTFAMYYFLHEQQGMEVNITGLDLKKDVIEKCQQLANRYGYKNLHFQVGDIKGFEGEDKVDMVVTLHACDTATDYALAKAVDWNAEVILSVPCCQHELNQQIDSELLRPILKYGLLKERMSALVTDGLRANFLEEAGYETQVLEFIDMEHTPKNILIRGMKKRQARKEENKEVTILMEELKVSPTLARLLRF